MEKEESRGAAAERAALNATRALLRIARASDARDIAVALVDELGGDVVEAADASADAVPLDVSFGAGPPLLPQAGSSVARMLLERFLPAFVEDGMRAIALVRTTDRLAIEAEIDPLTGLANRRASGRVLGRMQVGDTVMLIDLDHFKQLNDTLGHGQGDEVLKAFGAALRDEVRRRDHAGRHGGEEFIVVLPGTTIDAARSLHDRLRVAWEARRPHPVGFSAGIAAFRPGASCVVAADRALYRAKELGRDRAEVARDEDHR